VKTAPQMVTCPYCQQAAYRLTGKLGETGPGHTRFGCDNAHYFVYPEKFGYEPVSQRREAP
jgi:transposase-like protein